jgi:hypothetical protein
MAATRGTVQGYTKAGNAQQGQQSALGGGSVEAHADTWKTFSRCAVRADGSGYIEVRRGDKIIYFYFGPETDELEVVRRG